MENQGFQGWLRGTLETIREMENASLEEASPVESIRSVVDPMPGRTVLGRVTKGLQQSNIQRLFKPLYDFFGISALSGLLDVCIDK